MDYYHSKLNKSSSFPLQDLIDHFSIFKGVGQKTAQRLALEVISLSSEKVQAFAQELVNTKRNIKYCSVCYFLSLNDKCSICLDSNRSQQKICIVSEPKDVLAIEQSKTYTGVYHVLGGLISPLDGVYPEMLRFKELRQKIDQFDEVILALSPTVEGDTTGLYIQDLLSEINIPIYKLAQGIPIGADLAYLDEVTIDKAFQGKIEV